MRARGLKVGGLCREGIPRFARECSGPGPTGSKGTPGARSPPLDPSTGGVGRGASDQRSDSFKWTNAERAEGERPADIQTAE